MKKAAPKARASGSRDSLLAFRLRLAEGLKGRGSAAAEHLHDVLEGADLPALGGDDEPYEWILRALPEEPRERSSMVRGLARASAKLLRLYSDGNRTELFTKPVLYNLLFLAGNLHRPDELGDVLLGIYEKKLLSGTWEGFPMASGLRIALAANQVDKSLWPVWKSMLNGKPDTYLRGRQHDGFDGVRWMPPGRDQLHEPSLPEIGEALRCMADLFAPRETRRTDFRRVVNQLVGDYPRRTSWDADLVQLADRYDLPLWAVESLPTLFVATRKGKQEWVRVMLWRYLELCLGSLGEDWKVQQPLCNGAIRVVDVRPGLFGRLAKLARVFEHHRVTLSFPGDQGARNAALTAILALANEQSFEGRTDEAEVLLRAAKIVRDELVGFRRTLPSIPREPELQSVTSELNEAVTSIATEPKRAQRYDLRYGVLLSVWDKSKQSRVRKAIQRAAPAWAPPPNPEAMSRRISVEAR